jgi:hypothetical protein
MRFGLTAGNGAIQRRCAAELIGFRAVRPELFISAAPE